MSGTYSPLARASLVSGILALFKFAAFIQTNSLIVLASCLDSIVDTALSYINSRVAKYSLKKPDREHPFGHGGFEVISSLIQGMIIAFSGLMIAIQSIQRLWDPQTRLTIDHEVFFSIAVMLASALVGAGLSYYLVTHEKQLTERNERSLSLNSDRGHYLGDFISNLAGAIGLSLVWYFQRPELDAVFGLIGAIGLMKAAVPILKNSFRDILQVGIDASLQQKIVETIVATDPRIQGVHRLRSRGAGPSRFVDFHLKLPSELLLVEAHEIGDKVTRALRRLIPRVDVIIHLDPDTEPDDDLWEPVYQPPDLD